VAEASAANRHGSVKMSMYSAGECSADARCFLQLIDFSIFDSFAAAEMAQ